MVDRQDIDALLVGALYGELTPAEEARLAAHLESHPADRSALEDLKTARQAVRESKVFDFQHEPPQAISAMLLQEAHRRAPKPARVRDEKEGWFARLARSFLAHPAMAAAAMLVLVVGVAGTLYLRKGNDESAIKQANIESSAAPAGPALTATPPAAEAPQQGLDQGAAAAGSSVAVDLAEDEKKALERQQQDSPGRVADKNQIAKTDGYDRTRDMRKLEVSKPEPTAHRAPPSKPALEVHTQQLSPKDLDSPKAKASTKSNFAGDAEDIAGVANNDGIATGGAGGAARGGGKESASVNATVTAPRNAAPAAPAPVAQAPQAAPQPAPPPPPSVAKTPVAGNAPATKAAPPKSDPTTVRAQALLDKAIAAAHDQNCDDVANYARQIHTLSPAFYDQNVADNRAFKGCVYKIRDIGNAERAKKAPAPRATESAK